MLLESEKYHLSKLIKNYKSFEYLRPDPDIYQSQIPTEEIFIQNSKGLKKRKIYYKVVYDNNEQNKIREVKMNFSRMSICQNFSDQFILKHLYAVQMDVNKTLQRLKEVQKYHNNPIITTFTHQTQSNLAKGCIYTYGKDRKQNPIIVIRADKFDYSKSIEENFNSIYFLILVVVGYRMVPYHAEKYTLIIDIHNMGIRDFSISYLYSVIQKMNTIYSENIEKMFIYNSSSVKFIWSILSIFIPQLTKKKIHFIEDGNEEQILNYVDEYELQQKYGGKLQNLQQGQHWPPAPTNDFDVIGFQNISFQTDYYTIANNSFIYDDEISNQCKCSDCVIF